MPSAVLRLPPLILTLAVISCGHPPPPPPAPVVPAVPARVPAKDRLVILLSIDGLPAYALEDPRAPTPVLRRLAREGASARRMGIINPALTWPNHTTLTTGVPASKHGVLYNGRLLRGEPGQPVRYEPRDRGDLVRVPTVYDLAVSAGLKAAQVAWIPHQSGGTIAHWFGERPDAAGPIEKEMMALGTTTARDMAEFRETSGPWRDAIWIETTTHIVSRHRPNLLMLHLLNLDSIHHRHGPGSAAGLTALALADARVGALLEFLRAAGLRDRTTLLVVSDHGFKIARREVRANAVLRTNGLLTLAADKTVAGCDAYVMSHGGTGVLYVTRPDLKEILLPRLEAIFAGTEGVERVVTPDGYAALGLPTPEDNDQMGDLVIVAKPGYAITTAAVGDPVVDAIEGKYGHHGYLNSDPDMDAVFLAWGYGIRPGVRIDRIVNYDVAPTVAALLDLKMDGTDGHVLDDILK